MTPSPQSPRAIALSPDLPAIDYSLPVLSIRQPWATSIILGGKDVENRCWRDQNPGLRFRGRFLVHASKTMTQDEMLGWRDLIEEREIAAGWAKGMKFRDLPRGGIIGEAEIVDAVRTSQSKWFVGPWGLVIRNPKPIPFYPCLGRLGFFRIAHGPVLIAAAA